MNICPLATFDGPNRFDPRPDVLAHLCAGRDYGATLRAALKDAVQRIGLVIGALHIDSRIADGKVWHEAFFVTPMSVIGAGMLRYVVALLKVRDAGDEEWDTGGILNVDDPSILALADYAPCPLILIARSERAALRAHRAAEGSVLFLRDQAVVVACWQEEIAITPPPDPDLWQALVVEALRRAFAGVM